MAIDATLAQLSNGLVYGSMAVFATSFVAFATSLAAGRGRAELQDAVAAQARASSPAMRLTREGAAATGVGASAAVATMDAPTNPPDLEALAPGRRAGNIGLSLMWLATLLLTVGVATRGFSAGRPPWGNMYEFSLASAMVASVVFLLISTRTDLRWLGVFVTGAVLLTLGLAVTVLYSESAQLVPALESYWLIIHVSAAIICSAAFTIGAFTTVLYLVRDSAERKAAGGQVNGWLASRVPSADRLDGFAYRVTAFVFPLWTFAVIAGAIWAESAWGRYWGWDPKETWAFITWVIYACYLHARATIGWRGRKAAFIGLLGYVAFLFNYFGVNMLISGLHSYAGLQ